MTDLTQQIAGVKRMEERMAYLRGSGYCPFELTPKQWRFALAEEKEVMFGGAAGGGKTIAMLAAALLYVDKPSYRALILRRTYADLALPGAPMDIADQWLHGTDAKRKEAGKEWHFPSGAKIVFGYMSTDGDRYRYQSSRFDFIGFDEASQFTETQLRYLFTRLRQDKVNSEVPLRMRLASNPGGASHIYLKDRYVKPLAPTNTEEAMTARQRVFIPANLSDNPHLDVDAYRDMLAELDPYTRAQMEHGNWDAEPTGGYFDIRTLVAVPEHKSNGNWDRAVMCRAWDLAASGVGDYAVGTKLAYDRRTGLWRIMDVVRIQADPLLLEKTMRATAEKDGRGLTQVIEQELGSAGKLAMRDIRQRWLMGYPTAATPASGDKLTRARLPASLIAAGDVEMAPGRWNDDFLGELLSFPSGKYDDQVDSLGHAFAWVVKQVGSRKPRGTNVPQAEVVAKKPKLSITQYRIR